MSKRQRVRRMSTELLDRARNAVQDRAELPGMSLMEHLEELRRRLLWSIGYLVLGCCVAWFLLAVGKGKP